MNILKRFVAGLGQQTAPFGFAPNDPEAGYKAGLGYIGDVGANILANNQGGVNPWANLGASLQQAKADSTQRNKEQYTAQRLMEEAAAKKAEREQEAQRQAMIEERINQLPPELQGLARIAPDKVFGSLIEQKFAKPDLTTDMKNFNLAQANPEYAAWLEKNSGGGGGGNWGMSVVPLRNKETGELVAGQFNQGQGGLFVNGEPADPTKWEFAPDQLAESKASGALLGKAPESIITDYTKTNRPAMIALSDTVYSLREAKKYLEKGIQTGSLSDNIQALRSLGAQLGFNVDESILSNTQSYQNFIGNTVIPRMAALGGNDSNEELRKLYSLSGGDINQSLSALKDTLSFMDRLLEKKYKTLKSNEDVALKFIPGLTPVPFGYEGDTGGGDLPDFSQMTDEQLLELVGKPNGQ